VGRQRANGTYTLHTCRRQNSTQHSLCYLKSLKCKIYSLCNDWHRHFFLKRSSTAFQQLCITLKVHVRNATATTLRHAHGYLPSRRKSLTFDRYQFILLVDTDTRVWTVKCVNDLPKVVTLRESGVAGSQTHHVLCIYKYQLSLIDPRDGIVHLSRARLITHLDDRYAVVKFSNSGV